MTYFGEIELLTCVCASEHPFGDHIRTRSNTMPGSELARCGCAEAAALSPKKRGETARKPLRSARGKNPEIERF